MSNEILTITRARLVSLLGISAYPNPDDDGQIWKGPHGPGPVIRSWLDVLSRIALNPQPLPPKAFFLSALSGAILERADRVADLASLLPDQERSLGGQMSAELSEFEDGCGTMTRWELIQQLLSHIRRGVPPPPPPEPFWTEKLSQNDIIIVGGRIASDGASFRNQNIRTSLQNSGARLIEKNLSQSMSARTPVLEQV